MPRPTPDQLHAARRRKTAEQAPTPPDPDKDLAWGAKEIMAMWGLPDLNRTYHLLSTGALPGVQVINGRYCASRKARDAFFERASATRKSKEKQQPAESATI